jgi:hypothetical protein
VKVIPRNIWNEDVVATELGGDLQVRFNSTTTQGKIVHGGNFMPAKKKAAKKKKH